MACGDPARFFPESRSGDHVMLLFLSLCPMLYITYCWFGRRATGELFRTVPDVEA
jgi:hypothetical protein